jgi:hypothetical protein
MLPLETSSTVDGNTYTADITPDGNGNITIDVAAAVAVDVANNSNTAATQAIVVYDATAPTVDIQGEPANVNDLDPFTVTFEFSENVTGFVVGDITVANATVGNFVAVDGNTYTADITPDGNLAILLSTSQLLLQLMLLTTPNTAATQATVVYDATAPTVDIQGEPVNVNDLDPFTVTFEFSENVTGFVVGDISL